VKIIETAGRNPEPYRKQIGEASLIHIHKCARVKDAAKMSRMGVDAVSVVGTESGGHPGMSKITSMVLIPLAADSVSVPLIAGGGICDGRSLVAALSLGADGVVMGTRFITTRECLAHPSLKKRFMEADETDTVFVMESLQNPGRVLRNVWAEKVLELEKKGATLEDLAPSVSGKVSLKGWTEGKEDEGLFYCGQVVGRIRDTLSVAEVMEKIMDEALAVKAKLNKIL
jgi:nitronate monooxygenase